VAASRQGSSNNNKGKRFHPTEKGTATTRRKERSTGDKLSLRLSSEKRCHRRPFPETQSERKKKHGQKGQGKGFQARGPSPAFYLKRGKDTAPDKKGGVTGSPAPRSNLEGPRKDTRQGKRETLEKNGTAPPLASEEGGHSQEEIVHPHKQNRRTKGK